MARRPNTWTVGYSPSKEEIEREAAKIREGWKNKASAKKLNNEWEKEPYYPHIYKTPNL